MKKIRFILPLILILCSCERIELHRYGELILSDGPYKTQSSVILLQKYDNGSKTYRIDVKFTAKEDIDSAVLMLGFKPQEETTWWMMPAVSYNGNDWGRGNEPKGYKQDGQMRTYSYLRSPIPCATYSEGDKYAVATWTDKPSEADEAKSYGFDGNAHYIFWPEQEEPVTYCGRDRFADGWARLGSMAAGENRRLTMYVNVSKTETEHRSIRHFLKVAWKMMADKEIKNYKQKDVIPLNAVWDLGVQFVKESLWVEEGSFKGFSIGLRPNSDDLGWHQRERGKYEAGWCGQNISLCNSLMTDYLRGVDSADADDVSDAIDSRDKAITCLDCWARNCRLPNGLFVCHFDDVLAGNVPSKYAPGTPIVGKVHTVDACNLGISCCNFIEAYKLAGRCGFDRPEYLELALDALDFVISDQQEDGCYGRGWAWDGECVVRDGTVGAFLIPAMIAAYEQNSEEKYLESAKKAYTYYMTQLREDGYTTAGALDTWCIDKESAISLLRAAMRLRSIEEAESYLADAVQISNYLSTWMWHYDGVYDADDAFVQEGFHTFGATSVSVQHHHLDFYASLWVPEWYELSQLTGDSQWSEKAQVIMRNSTQLISDGELILNGRLRPAGSQNEAWFQCSWGFYNDGSDYACPPISRDDRINDWLVAWPTAFRLETMRREFFQ